MKPEHAQSADKKFKLAVDRKVLRKFRKQAGLSLMELGAMTKLSESSLSRFESGKRGLSPEALTRLEAAIVDVLSEKRAANKLAALRESRAAKKLMPSNTIPLSSLATADHAFNEFKKKQAMETLDRTKDRIIEIQQELIQAYRDGVEELVGENSDLQKSLNEKEARLKELRDLLGLETEAALLRDKIEKPVTVPEGGE